MFPDMTHAMNWSACPAIELRDGLKPQKLSEISSVSPGHQYVQYRAELSTWDPSLTPTLFNVSISYNTSQPEVVLARSSGSICFTSAYYYLPDQDLIYENGAVIKNQTGGNFILRNSGISAAKANSAQMSLSLFDLTGPPVSADRVYSGPATTLITVYREDYELVSDSFYYPNLTLNITTTYPHAWSSWLNKTLKDAGLTAGYDYDDPLTITDDSVQVVFNGHDTGVKLYLDRTTLQVRILRPS